MTTRKRTPDYFLKWVAGIGASMVVLLLAWIGNSVTSIPVMQNDIATIKTDINAQVTTNMKRLDDHENRIRDLEGRRK